MKATASPTTPCLSGCGVEHDPRHTDFCHAAIAEIPTQAGDFHVDVVRRDGELALVVHLFAELDHKPCTSNVPVVKVMWRS